MRRNCIALVVFFAVLGYAGLSSSVAQESSVVGKETVDDLRFWDFGRVKKGSVVHHDFVICNSFSRTVRIIHVSSSCGCTVSEVKKKVLAPQEETVLAVQFNSADYDGKVQQFVYVTTDNPENPTMRFTISATVVQ